MRPGAAPTPCAFPCRRSRSGISPSAVRGRRHWRPGSRTTVWRAAARRASCCAVTAETSPSFIGGLCPRRSCRRQELAVLVGRGVVAAAGIADPESFAEQLGAAGASVQLVAYQDHHAYRQADLERLVRAAAGGDYVVVTEKDAVKLRRQWPGSAAEPLVAVLAVQWERNGRALEQAVDAVLASCRRAWDPMYKRAPCANLPSRP